MTITSSFYSKVFLKGDLVVKIPILCRLLQRGQINIRLILGNYAVNVTDDWK